MINEVENYNLKFHNTFRVDAVCSRWLEFSDANDLPEVATKVAGNKFMCIGGGSNLLFIHDYDGTIIHSRILDAEMSVRESDGRLLLRAGSGIVMDSLIEQCCINEIWGLENLSGIPGEVGAAAVQNVGAYGVEAKDVIESVECYDMLKKEFVIFSASECDFGYRHSMFKTDSFKNRYAVTYVTFLLKSKPDPKLEYGNLHLKVGNIHTLTPTIVREAVMDLRAQKLPPVEKYGSAGSFFKNPVVGMSVFNRVTELVKKAHGEDCCVPHFKSGDDVKIPAAWLIEQCGFKGFTYGNVGVWHLQPLVIVNLTGKATAREIMYVENMIKTKVQETFGIELTPEVEHVK